MLPKIEGSRESRRTPTVNATGRENRERERAYGLGGLHGLSRVLARHRRQRRCRCWCWPHMGTATIALVSGQSAVLQKLRKEGEGNGAMLNQERIEYWKFARRIQLLRRDQKGILWMISSAATTQQLWL